MELLQINQLVSEAMTLAAPALCPECGGPVFASKRPKKFCTEKCRTDWHVRNRDCSVTNERKAFAMHLLKFMEKNFPEQLRKMRVGYEKKLKEKANDAKL